MPTDIEDPGLSDQTESPRPTAEEPETAEKAPPGDRTKLTELSSRAYEHPSDRAALTGLRKVPGFDLVLRKLIGLIGERRLRYLMLGSAVRVNDQQFRRLNAIYQECVQVLDLPERPELYVAQTPFVNAGAVGVDRPFIQLNSATIELLSDDELRFILGHELGHILSDHVLYKTMLGLLIQLALVRFGIPIASLALAAIIAALTEWDRKSELSADRAGLLCLQDPWTAYTVIMKMAGGRQVDQMDITEFIRQAEEYESGGDQLDSLIKLLNLMGRRHPFAVLRLAELKRWVERGDYDRILAGDYARRGEDDRASVYQEFTESARSYQRSYQESKEPLVQFFRELGDQVSEKSGHLWDRLKERFGRQDQAEGHESEDEPDK